LYTRRQLLANLWARGAALQCTFSQESIDFLIPLYFGSVDPDSEFDPSRLSGGVGQVKFKVAGDQKAEAAIRPIGVPRDRQQPLPYLAILMELGNESHYKGNNSKIRYTTSEPPVDGKFGKLCDAWDAAVKTLESYRRQSKQQKETFEKLKKEAKDARLAMDSCNRYSSDEFGKLCDAWDAAVKTLESYRRQSKQQKETLEKLKKEANDARFAMDSCNRYSLSARGISQDVYGILRDAGIEKEFATLLSIIMPSPVDERSTRQHMRPLERLSATSSHTDWMSEYVVSNESVSDDDIP
jgi:hypothetical protein